MRKLEILSIVIVFSITIAVIPTSNNASQTIKNPGTMIFEGAGYELQVETLDPATDYDAGVSLTQWMYEGLYQYANNSAINFKPDLATGYTISADGLTYTFTIRTGVTFALQPGETVGQPFNAFIMQYSIDRAIIMNDPYGPAWLIQDWIKGAQILEGNTINLTQANAFLALKSVWATDATHLRITLRTPFSGFLSTLLSSVAYAVSPKAIIDNKPSNYTTKSDPTYGMVSLASFFPGTTNTTILINLGLPSNYKIDDSGVVPQSGHFNINSFDWFKTHSAGTGPYTLVEIVQGDHAYFEKNTNWWDSAHFHVNSPDTIKVITVLDLNKRIQDFKDGVTDSANIPQDLLGHYGISPSHLISNTTGIKAYVNDALGIYVFGMNQADNLALGQVVEDEINSNYNYGTKNVTNLLKYSWNYPNGSQIMASPGNPFSSLLFRKAFAYSFPYEEYNSETLNGYSFRAQGAIPYGLLGHNDNLISNGNIPSQNLTKARDFFNQVGWKGNINIYYPYSLDWYQLADILLKNTVESLNVGININVIQTTWTDYVNLVLSGEACLWEIGTGPSYADPHDITVQFYLGGVGWIANAENYKNPQLTSLIEAGSIYLLPSERSTIYQKMEVNATGDYPYIYLFQLRVAFVLRDWIIGVDDPANDALNPLHDLRVQFLGKGNNVFTTESKSISSLPSSTSSIANSVTGFETGSIITLSLIFVPKISKRKKW